jgi:hypothetical protein
MRSDNSTVDYLGHLVYLAQDRPYAAPLAPLERIERLVEVQKVSAEALRQAVAAARGAGATWAALGAATGLSGGTVLRQWASGGPVVAVRAKHARLNGNTPLPDGAVQDPLFDLADLAA